MQSGHKLSFSCLLCEKAIHFSILNTQQGLNLACPHCSKIYALNNEKLLQQLKKFEGLCRQIHESEEILGNTAVAIDVGPHHVKVPYRLLLTRLNSTLELIMENRRVEIAFRIEPLKDVPESAPT